MGSAAALKALATTPLARASLGEWHLPVGPVVTLRYFDPLGAINGPSVLRAGNTFWHGTGDTAGGYAWADLAAAAADAEVSYAAVAARAGWGRPRAIVPPAAAAAAAEIFGRQTRRGRAIAAAADAWATATAARVAAGDAPVSDASDEDFDATPAVTRAAAGAAAARDEASAPATAAGLARASALEASLMHSVRSAVGNFVDDVTCAEQQHSDGANIVTAHVSITTEEQDVAMNLEPQAEIAALSPPPSVPEAVFAKSLEAGAHQVDESGSFIAFVPFSNAY